VCVRKDSSRVGQEVVDEYRKASQAPRGLWERKIKREDERVGNALYKSKRAEISGTIPAAHLPGSHDACCMGFVAYETSIVSNEGKSTRRKES
jgi:hypothetical protein